MPKDLATYIVPLVVAAIIIRRTLQARTVNTSRMWIRPVMFLILIGGTFWNEPVPGLLAIAGFVAAAAVGVALGYYMAQHQHLTIDENGKVSSQATTVGTFLVLGLFAIRFGAKIAFPELAHPGHAGTEVNDAANALLIFTVAVLLTRTMALYSRTRPLLAAHAASKAAAAVPAEAKAPPTQ